MQLTYDGDTNTLRLTPESNEQFTAGTTDRLDGILDVGQGGRLIGVEFPADTAGLALWIRDPAAHQYISLDSSGRAYIQITDGDHTTARSTPIELIADFNAQRELVALAIPRRGDGYEITYPSGNQ